MIASPQRETYSASISINRPFSITPMFVIQMRAATIDPLGPRLPRATVTNATATASTIAADGRRAVHSLRTPKIRNDAATRLEHSYRRQDSSSFFSFDCNRAKRLQINHRPPEKDDKKGSRTRIHWVLHVRYWALNVKSNRTASLTRRAHNGNLSVESAC